MVRHWTEETGREAAELYRTFTEAKIRRYQDLADQQMRRAYDQRNEDAMADLQAMRDALSAELARRLALSEARKVKSGRRERRQFGDQRACGTCEADIEWHGREHGWLDRGGNTRCDTGGQAWQDQDGVMHEYPRRKHRPGSSFTLPPGARRVR